MQQLLSHRVQEGLMIILIKHSTPIQLLARQETILIIKQQNISPSPSIIFLTLKMSSKKLSIIIPEEEVHYKTRELIMILLMRLILAWTLNRCIKNPQTSLLSGQIQLSTRSILKGYTWVKETMPVIQAEHPQIIIINTLLVPKVSY